MSVDRITRVNELLRREIAEALFRVVAESDLDCSTLTVTGVNTTRDLRSARVMVSVRADAEGQRRMLALLRRRRGDIQACINRDLIIKYTPRLTFQLDPSIRRGDRMLELLDRIAADPEQEKPCPSDR